MSSSHLQPVKPSIFRTLAVVLMGCLIAGCSWMRPGEEGIFLNPKDDYLDAYQHPELEVPEDLPEIGDSDPFPIPPTEVAENPQFYPNRPPLPDAIYANDKRDEVRIQRLGTRRWLVIPEEPTTVWPKLKQFLADNGVAVPWENPK